jgi:hypothetical protein
MIEDNRETRANLTEAWRAAARRLIEQGYPTSAVLGTMAVVALNDVELERTGTTQKCDEMQPSGVLASGKEA